jgi:hypothetical protein
VTPRRIDPRPLQESLDSLEQRRLELGTTPAELVAERIADARTELMEALKLADRYELRDAHVRIGSAVIGLDDVQAVLMEHGRGERS